MNLETQRQETLNFWDGELNGAKKEGPRARALPKQLPEGTRVFDAVTDMGPYYILPLPLDSEGRIAVYSGERAPNMAMTYERMWCSALKPVPEPQPKVRDWDELLAYSLGGVISGVLLLTTLAVLDLVY